MRGKKVVVHPPSFRANLSRSTLQLRPGDPAAPRAVHLPLLPSGPDGVRRHLPRGDRILITFKLIATGNSQTSGRNTAPHTERFGYRVARAPRLARPALIVSLERLHVNRNCAIMSSSMPAVPRSIYPLSSYPLSSPPVRSACGRASIFAAMPARLLRAVPTVPLAVEPPSCATIAGRTLGARNRAVDGNG